MSVISGKKQKHLVMKLTEIYAQEQKVGIARDVQQNIEGKLSLQDTLVRLQKT